jgi:ABC-type phosphate/phosphonate transport system substrate-binding protein
MTWKTLTLTILLLTLTQTYTFANDIDFTVLDMKGGKKTEEQWKPLAEYLKTQIDQTVHFRTLPNASFVKRSAGRDVLLTNPVNAVILEDRGEFEIVATLNHIKQGSSFAGVIIVHKDSAINDLKDLAGKKVGVVDKKFAAGGFLFQANELLNAGLIPDRDFNNFNEMANQRAIVLRVITKSLDAGFIRTGMLESLKSVYDVSQVRILNRMDGKLPFPRSTAIYPHWAILVNKKISAQMREKITNSLLEIEPDSKTSKSGKMKGFVPAADYSSIKTVIKRMKTYNFQN